MLDTESDKKSDLVIICHKSNERNANWVINVVQRDSLRNHTIHGDIIPDEDDDGYTKANPCHCGNGDDCNDEDPKINPGSIEICGDLIDNNCNKRIDETCTDDCSYKSPKPCNICKILDVLGEDPDFFDSCMADSLGDYLVLRKAGSNKQYILALVSGIEPKYSSSTMPSTVEPRYEPQFKISKEEYQLCREALKKWATSLKLEDQCDN